MTVTQEVVDRRYSSAYKVVAIRKSSPIRAQLGHDPERRFRWESMRAREGQTPDYTPTQIHKDPEIIFDMKNLTLTVTPSRVSRTTARRGINSTNKIQSKSYMAIAQAL
jgi:hypothetical protein